MVSGCEKSGVRTYVSIPQDKCIIEFSEAGDYLQVYEYPVANSVSGSDKHVVRSQYQLSCKAHDDFFINPVLKGLLVFIGIMVSLLLILGVCFCRKYRTLKVKYSKLSEDDGGEIEMQQVTN